jgi:YVTN family beta-propeller protein
VGSSSGSSTIVPIDRQTGVAAAPIVLGAAASYPYDATLRPGGAELWVAGASGDGVVIVSTADNSIIDSVALAGVCDYPVGIAFSPDGQTAYLSGRDTENVVGLDADTHAVVSNHALPGSLDGGKIAVDPCSSTAYLVDWFDGTFLVYTPSTGTFVEKPFGDSLWNVAVDSTGSHVYVTDRGQNVVHAYDVATGAVTATAPTGDDPWGIAISPDDSQLVITNEDDGTVTFVDTTGLTTTTLVLPAGADPRDVEIDESGALAYVTSGDIPGNDALYVIDMATHALVDTIDLGVSINANVVAVSPQPWACSLP